MKENRFLRAVGIVALIVPLTFSCVNDSGGNSIVGCQTVPFEEEGPYPFPGGEIKNNLLRVNITEGQTGVPLSLTFIVYNIGNACAVLPNAQVHIWHANKDGYYSGYDGQTGGVNGPQNFSGQFWLRGFQTTDSNGTVTFNTIYPGWEDGRATHLHIEIFVNGVVKRQIQLAFPETISEAVHVTSAYSAHGVNPTSNLKDPIFGNSSSDLTAETLTLTGTNGTGYSSTFNLVIQP